MMKRKLVWTAVLAAMVATGTTGVYAAPTLEDHETRIVDLEKLTDKIDDRSETDHLAIKGLKQNKADKAETEAARRTWKRRSKRSPTGSPSRSTRTAR